LKRQYLKKAITLILLSIISLSLIACDTIKDTASGVGDWGKNSATTIADGVSDLIGKIKSPEDSDDVETMLENITVVNITAFLSELKGNVNLDELFNELKGIESNTVLKIANQDDLLQRIDDEIKIARDFITDPSHILGNDSTKHGEVAEHLEVMARNSEKIADGLEPDALKSTERTGPTDLIVGGKNVQVKFYNAPLLTLNAVYNSLKDNPGVNDYSLIPKNQYDEILKMRETEGSYSTVKTYIERIESISGKRLEDAVRPARFDYRQVQLDNVRKTISEYKVTIKKPLIMQREAFLPEANAAKSSAISAAIKTDFLRTGQTAAFAASLEVFISVGFSIYYKVQSGKTIDTFTEQDWKDIGIDALVPAARGVAGGASIEVMTIFGMPAPIAAAVIAASFRILELSFQYKSGEIDSGEFVSLALQACIDSSLIGAGAFIGQVLIPVPVVGAIVGGLATTIVLSIIKTNLSASKQLQEQTDEFIHNFKTSYNELIAQTSETIGEAGNATMLTLTSTYDATKDKALDAISAAKEKTESIYNNIKP
jgi:hypothetical protein